LIISSTDVNQRPLTPPLPGEDAEAREQNLDASPWERLGEDVEVVYFIGASPTSLKSRTLTLPSPSEDAGEGAKSGSLSLGRG